MSRYRGKPGSGLSRAISRGVAAYIADEQKRRKEEKYEWRMWCEDGSDFGVNPQRFETELDYLVALDKAKERKYAWRDDYLSDYIYYGVDPEEYEDEEDYLWDLESAKQQEEITGLLMEEQEVTLTGKEAAEFLAEYLGWEFVEEQAPDGSIQYGAKERKTPVNEGCTMNSSAPEKTESIQQTPFVMADEKPVTSSRTIMAEARPVTTNRTIMAEARPVTPGRTIVAEIRPKEDSTDNYAELVAESQRQFNVSVLKLVCTIIAAIFAIYIWTQGVFPAVREKVFLMKLDYMNTVMMEQLLDRMAIEDEVITEMYVDTEYAYNPEGEDGYPEVYDCSAVTVYVDDSFDSWSSQKKYDYIVYLEDAHAQATNTIKQEVFYLMEGNILEAAKKALRRYFTDYVHNDFVVVRTTEFEYRLNIHNADDPVDMVHRSS